MKERKITLILLLILSVLLSLLIFIQYKVFYDTNPNFLNLMEDIMAYSSLEEWDKTEKSLKILEYKWNKAKPLVTLKYSDQDYSRLNIEFANLRGAVYTKDADFIQRKIRVCMVIFRNITSIMPIP
ncbi:DUF4363 family protein [Tepidibacter hydrothermalis]|uniref:DUF4363 family protein n=1 Tax=Tepidibacter hydrothermalis TaxID=3036126 RepID=A0ABY8E7I9_9FIRM|nr:DUF4363 family protein [Tepidibacter hydrothermalis]WFD08852.1 DUF4363 family protein [Tepidibacter hydrothermalis]